MTPSSSSKSSGKGSSSSSSSRSSASNGTKSTSSSAPTRKLSSMSSFQPTLSFKTTPKSVPSTSSPASSSASSRPSASSSSSSSRDEVDRKLMPPPPPGTKLKPSISPQKASNGDVKGKRKEEPVVVLDDDEDEEMDGSYRPEEAQMWTELYGPTHETELAPGKARIAKVKNWLHESIFGYPFDAQPPPRSVNTDKIRKYKRVLFLSGPAGVGKATTARLLCASLGVEIMEWGESVEEWSLGGGIDRESAISKFNSFISRNSYPSLSMSSQTSALQSPDNNPRIILLTALPNLSHVATREAFHASLLTFCQNFNSLSCPMVIVHSDAGSGGRAEESWMDRERGGREGSLEVLGREVRDGPWCQEIDFLPLAPTFLNKALLRVLQTAIPRALDRPSHATIQLIAHSCNGDLRSAINSLQLLCGGRKENKSKKRKGRQDEADEDLGTRKRGAGRGSRGGKGGKLDVSRDLRAVLDAVTRKEQSLNLFHALGKVLYNKRLDDPNMEDEDEELLERIRKLPADKPLPNHLQGFTRRKSLVQMETFIPTIPIDASSFALWLHQSVPNYCNEIEEVSAGLDALCSADIMRTDDDIWQSSTQAIAYALHLSVRGILMSLPSPVPRRSQKATKPQFFESYKLERDNTSALDHVAGYITKKGISASNAFANGEARDEGVWGGMYDKRVLAGELVPMMVKLQILSAKPILPSSAQTLCLPPYSSFIRNGVELTAKDEIDMDDEYEASAAGDDGLGNIDQSHTQAWDDEPDKKEEEEDWLVDDDIDDFD
ncbi:uncharacterized protein I303_103484 [Kwoniella dejecticola CBS 10117]|uniref:Cell cycle checkpoint protein n=1 Tax=Kwoniella dejecticola CBS 10117 TaxID=1296121 RepID=A0A1A6A6V8_9TREE|nr:uncharacterized protein I303_03507 [Kwoniella dejecticola CBS 10117]OBR85794.1 hypothetical protein I303_03507 [Kwoniella dejecticola CBS 10117]